MYAVTLTDTQIIELIAKEEEDRRALERRTNQDWVTPKDVAHHFGVHPSTVYVWIVRGWIKTHPHQKHQRYQILLEELNTLTDHEYELLPRLRKFLPRVLFGEGR